LKASHCFREGLLRFIDWLIRLPQPLELALGQELAELEEQSKMSYVI